MKKYIILFAVFCVVIDMCAQENNIYSDTLPDYVKMYTKNNHNIYIFGKEYSTIMDIKPFGYFNDLYKQRITELDTSLVFYIDSILTEKEFVTADSVHVLNYYKKSLIEEINYPSTDFKEFARICKNYETIDKEWASFSYLELFLRFSNNRQFIGYEDANGEKYIIISVLYKKYETKEKNIFPYMFYYISPYKECCSKDVNFQRVYVVRTKEFQYNVELRTLTGDDLLSDKVKEYNRREAEKIILNK
jgi:hypothetical protein